MKIGEHGLRDHLRLLAPMFGLIAAVWALRWIMALASTPPGLVRMMSVSVAGAVAVLVAVVIIHFKRSKTEFANIDRLNRIEPVAFTAF